MQLQVVTFDYGMKTKNPVDEIRFYRKNDLKNPFQYPKEEVSQTEYNTFNYKQKIYIIIGFPDASSNIQ